MKLLELFKGTGSVGKVAKKMGFNEIISIDFDPIYTPTIETDILKWNYKKFYIETGFIPDFIWASPPCNTFSKIAYFKMIGERNTQTAEPYSERAKIGTKILYKTLNIIKFFNKLNPNMGYCIENPHGMMRHDKRMKKLYTESTYYCLYGDKKRKYTDFWSNFIMNLDQSKKCNNKNLVNVVDMKLNDRYSIPPKLIKHIINNFLSI